MRSAKSTTLNLSKIFSQRVLCITLLLFTAQFLFAQENSPYSRYGLGDMVPNTNVISRGMGGISAGYVDILSINYNNPASYSKFQTRIEGGRVITGRVLLDVGLNFDSRTLSTPNVPGNFNSSYGYFSHVQLGIPLNKNWGMSFGLRPLSRVNYKINRLEELTDPLTGNKIDSALTEFSGNGGTFLPNIGTGFAIKNFSIGASMSYLFGRKEFNTRRSLYNGTTAYASSNHATSSYLGDLLFSAGAQYKINIDKQTALNLGVSGNWQQNISASRDLVRETFGRSTDNGDVRIDSVFEALDEKGEVVYPASYTAGFIIDHTEEKGNGWLLGVDYSTTQWDNYLFFGEKDDVKTNWKLRVGGQIRPTPSRNYWSNVAYRAGFFVGPDYINVGKQLPQFGVTAGLALPIAAPRMNPGQFTIINFGFEYSRRGNDDNILRENLFRVSVGLNFSDLWFSKRRYD